MMILMLTIPVTFTMVLLFIVLFLLATRDGQFEDLETPKHTPFLDDEINNNEDIEMQTIGRHKV